MKYTEIKSFGAVVAKAAILNKDLEKFIVNSPQVHLDCQIAPFFEFVDFFLGIKLFTFGSMDLEYLEKAEQIAKKHGLDDVTIEDGVNIAFTRTYRLMTKERD